MVYKIGVFFGGQSAEHEVSIESARNVINLLDQSKYEIIPVGIDQKGLWHFTNFSLNFGVGESFNSAIDQIFSKIDIAFSLLHGPFGEDGSFQGLFEVANIPYVGAGVLGSSIGLDKDVMKRLLRDAKIKIPKFLVFKTVPVYRHVVKELGLPLVIKSSNMGSSVCLTKANSEKEFIEGVELAFNYDSKIIIEENINCREIECAILDLNPPIASLPGEVVAKGGIYTYENKYIEKDGARFILPAKLDRQKIGQVQELAIKVFEVLCCEGMGRVDFFLDENQDLYVNEINTIPGFTEMSLYPKLWEISGVSPSKLLDRLIENSLLKYNQSTSKQTRPLIFT